MVTTQDVAEETEQSNGRKRSTPADSAILRCYAGSTSKIRRSFSVRLTWTIAR